MTERILHFLRSFPPWITLTALVVFFVVLYKTTGDVAYKEWTSLILASLFTALGVRATQSANTGSGDINVLPDAPIDLTQPEVIGLAENIKEEK